jgi:hypothetical protein
MKRADHVADAEELSCVYFCSSNPRYAADDFVVSRNILAWAYQTVADLPTIREFSADYRKCLGVDLDDMLTRSARPPEGQSLLAYATAADLIAARFAESVAGENVASVAFDGNGAESAFIFAGCLSFQQWAQQLAPLIGSDGVREAVVQDTHQLHPRVSAHLWDTTEPQHFHLANHRNAHSYDAIRLKAAVDQLSFRPPRCLIIGTDGTTIDRGCVEQGALRSTFMRGLLDGPGERRIGPVARSSASRVVLVGAPTVSDQRLVDAIATTRSIPVRDLILEFAASLA